MKAEKTIVCRIADPNKGKLNILEEEYDKVQKYIHEKDADIYSATVQALDEYTDWKNLKDEKEYPWYLRNDTFSVKKAENTAEFDYWARIPVKGVWGGVTVPVIPHKEIKEDYDIRDSKIVRKDYGFELHLSVSKEVESVETYNGAVGVDMGLNKLAVSVSLPDHQTRCYGTHIGDIQAKYYFLRRNCSDGYVRRKWDNKDRNKIEDICHQISRKIVDRAKEKNLLIVLGHLDRIQEDDKGRKNNRKLHNFPHSKLRDYIKYKAKWEGIEVIEVSEAYTSQRCSRCGEIGDRHRGTFKCDNCGLETDADKNGAHNIARRGIGKFEKTSSDVRGVVTTPEATTVDPTSASAEVSSMDKRNFNSSAQQVSEVGGNLC